MFTFNLTQIVYLTAQTEAIPRIIVVGNFMDVPEFMLMA
jgi:pantothenate kinase